MERIWKTFLWQFCLWGIALILLDTFIQQQKGWRYWAVFMAIGLVNSLLQTMFQKLWDRRKVGKPA